MMLPTVSCPANWPSTSTTHGSVTPRLASLRIVLTIAMYGPRLVRYSGVSGLVGSHGRSHAALRTRASRHVGASLTLIGRRVTGAPRSAGSVRVAHPCVAATRPSLRGQGLRAIETRDRKPDELLNTVGKPTAPAVAGAGGRRRGLEQQR